jgi:hypothetical protein
MVPLLPFLFINYLIVGPAGSDGVFGFGLDIIFWYVCLLLPIGVVKNNHQ